MRKDFNKSVFDSMPDTVWTGDMPEFNKSKQGKTLRFVTQIAAALSIPLAAATIILASRGPKSSNEEALVSQEIVYKVNNTLRGEITLPDSSIVKLNSGSVLKVAADFGQKNRTVWLDGEAYFDIHKDRSCPFYIKTPQDVEVKVTGTRFNMQCYSDNPKFDLTPIQGSVEVKTSNNEVIKVLPSQNIVISNEFHNVSRVYEPSESLVWTEGILKFDNTPMSETIAMIERWYGVDINVMDKKILQSSFTAEFKSETLDEVMRLLCISSNLRYKADESSIILESDK